MRNSASSSAMERRTFMFIKGVDKKDVRPLPPNRVIQKEKKKKLRRGWPALAAVRCVSPKTERTGGRAQERRKGKALRQASPAKRVLVQDVQKKTA